MLYTSYYAKRSIAPFKKYSISNSSSRWIKLDGKIPELVPPWQIVSDSKSGKITKSEYTEKYLEFLNGVNSTVIEKLRKMQESDEVYILLCWEKSSDFCHRHVLRKWLRDNHNIDIHEWK